MEQRSFPSWWREIERTLSLVGQELRVICPEVERAARVDTALIVTSIRSHVVRQNLLCGPRSQDAIEPEETLVAWRIGIGHDASVWPPAAWSLEAEMITTNG